MQYPRFVVAAGGVELAVVHQLAEHVDGHSGVGVPLGEGYLY
jgi:hypothetical protein